MLLSCDVRLGYETLQMLSLFSHHNSAVTETQKPYSLIPKSWVIIQYPLDKRFFRYSLMQSTTYTLHAIIKGLFK